MKGLILLALLAGTAPQSAFAPTSQGQAVALGEEEGNCVICHEDCPLGQHIAVNSGMSLPANWYKNGGAHLYGQCASGSCQSNHGPQTCGGLASAEFDELHSDLDRGNTKRIRQTLASHPERVKINRARQAIQVSDCSGGTYAHFPIDTAILAAIAD